MSLCIQHAENVVAQFEENDVALAVAEKPGADAPFDSLLVHVETGAVLARKESGFGWVLTAGGLLFQTQPPVAESGDV